MKKLKKGFDQALQKQYFESYRQLRKDLDDCIDENAKKELREKYVYYRNLLITEKLELVHQLAQKYANDSASKEELFEIGSVALTELFDKSKNDYDYFYKIELYKYVRRAMLLYLKKCSLGLDDESYEALVSKPSEVDIDDVVFLKLLKDYIASAFKEKLNFKEERIIRMRYGIQDMNCPREEYAYNHTISEIAEDFGLSKTRIEIILEDILASLKKYALSNDLGEYFGITLPKERMINFKLRINHLKDLFLSRKLEVLQIIDKMSQKEQKIIFLVLSGIELEESEEVLNTCFKVRRLLGNFVYIHPEVYKAYYEGESGDESYLTDLVKCTEAELTELALTFFGSDLGMLDLFQCYGPLLNKKARKVLDRKTYIKYCAKLNRYLLEKGKTARLKLINKQV